MANVEQATPMEVDDDTTTIVQPVKEACLVGQGSQSMKSLFGQVPVDNEPMFGMKVVMNGQMGYIPHIGSSVSKFLER